MPLYEIHHTFPISSDQEQKLADAVTTIHTRKFTTPSLFVNVEFRDISPAGAGERMYVGGRKKPTNRILAHVRPGPSRTASDYNDLCQQLLSAWNDILLTSSPSSHPNPSTTSGFNSSLLSSSFLPSASPPASEPNKNLHAIFILGTIVAGLEAGFPLPPAGQDGLWLKENMGRFRELAEGGDEEFGMLVKEVGGREDLRGLI